VDAQNRLLQFNKDLSVLSETLDIQTLKQTNKNWHIFRGTQQPKWYNHLECITKNTRLPTEQLDLTSVTTVAFQMHDLICGCHCLINQSMVLCHSTRCALRWLMSWMHVQYTVLQYAPHVIVYRI